MFVWCDEGNAEHDAKADEERKKVRERPFFLYGMGYDAGHEIAQEYGGESARGECDEKVSDLFRFHERKCECDADEYGAGDDEIPEKCASGRPPGFSKDEEFRHLLYELVKEYAGNGAETHNR